MRTDSKARNISLTPRQHFFASCWFNMVHQHSLDSHRVRTMNPRNVLRELLRMWDAAHANDEDRAMVRDEAIVVLSGDPVLQQPAAAQICGMLIGLLKTESKAKPGNNPLLQHFARELLDFVESSYIDSSLELLRNMLVSANVPEDGGEYREQLSALTCGLLSTLADEGASLETLYQLYRQIIVPPERPKTYVFEHKLGLLARILKEPPTLYRVLFAIDNIKSAEHYPRSMGGIVFSRRPEGWQCSSGSVAAYLTPQSRRVFAEVQVKAREVRAAGREAHRRVSNVLDLARFEYEPERIHLAEEFLITEATRGDRIRRYPVPKLVPNPDGITGLPDLHAFVQSVDELLSAEKFSQEGRDRVLSAFRLYRLGADANSFESKLANWWTAIEFLVRGLKGGTRIGSAVENNVAPVLCLAYPRTLLLDTRLTISSLPESIIDPATHAPLELSRDPGEIFRVFRRDDIRAAVTRAFSNEPYLQWKISNILGALFQPAACRSLLSDHERRVRWQIQRVWRARCDIVHSARRAVSESLLCANLEFYLKMTLMSLLAQLRRVKTLSGPEEFFERQGYTYQRLSADLDADSSVALEATLASG
jgi:hypothetical protein